MEDTKKRDGEPLVAEEPPAKRQKSDGPEPRWPPMAVLMLKASVIAASEQENFSKADWVDERCKLPGVPSCYLLCRPETTDPEKMSEELKLVVQENKCPIDIGRIPKQLEGLVKLDMAESMHAFFEAHRFGKWTEDELAAVYRWTHAGCESMWCHFEQNKLDATDRLLLSALLQGPKLPRGMRLFQGRGASEPAADIPHASELKVGDTFISRGPLSTSWSPMAAASFATSSSFIKRPAMLLVIDIDSDAIPGLSTTAIKQDCMAPEAEIMLPPGVRLEVTSISPVAPMPSTRCWNYWQTIGREWSERQPVTTVYLRAVSQGTMPYDAEFVVKFDGLDEERRLRLPTTATFQQLLDKAKAHLPLASRWNEYQFHLAFLTSMFTAGYRSVRGGQLDGRMIDAEWLQTELAAGSVNVSFSGVQWLLPHDEVRS